MDQSDLADTPPLQFIAGVAGDLQIPDERAIGMATNWVAGHCRSRIVEVGLFGRLVSGKGEWEGRALVVSPRVQLINRHLSVSPLPPKHSSPCAAACINHHPLLPAVPPVVPPTGLHCRQEG